MSTLTIVTGLPGVASNLRDGEVDATPERFWVIKQRFNFFKLGTQSEERVRGTVGVRWSSI